MNRRSERALPSTAAPSDPMTPPPNMALASPGGTLGDFVLGGVGGGSGDASAGGGDGSVEALASAEATRVAAEAAAMM